MVDYHSNMPSFVLSLVDVSSFPILITFDVTLHYCFLVDSTIEVHFLYSMPILTFHWEMLLLCQFTVLMAKVRFMVQHLYACYDFEYLVFVDIGRICGLTMHSSESRVRMVYGR